MFEPWSPQTYNLDATSDLLIITLHHNPAMQLVSSRGYITLRNTCLTFIRDKPGAITEVLVRLIDTLGRKTLSIKEYWRYESFDIK